MGRLYSAPFSGAIVSGTLDFFELVAGATTAVQVHGWSMFQTSDVGDAAEEIVRIETVRGVGSVTSGEGGTTLTVLPRVDTDVATAAVVESLNTIRMATGAGSLEYTEQHGWNVRIPWIHYYTPELRPHVLPSARWTLALPASPADPITVGGTLWFEEI